MNQETKLDGLKFLAESHRGAFQENLKRSFRVTYSALTFFSLLTASLYNDKINSSVSSVLTATPIFLYLAWAGLLCIAIISASSVYYMSKSGAFLKSLTEREENEIIDLIEHPSILPPEKRHNNPNSHGFWFRIAMIFAVMLFPCVSLWVIAS